MWLPFRETDSGSEWVHNQHGQVYKPIKDNNKTNDDGKETMESEGSSKPTPIHVPGESTAFGTQKLSLTKGSEKASGPVAKFDVWHSGKNTQREVGWNMPVCDVGRAFTRGEIASSSKGTSAKLMTGSTEGSSKATSARKQKQKPWASVGGGTNGSQKGGCGQSGRSITP